MSYTVKCVVDQVSELGECPVWSVREQVLYWADILAGQLHRLDPQTGGVTSLTLGEHLGCFGLRRQGGFIVALRTGIYLLGEDGTLGRKVADNPAGPQTVVSTMVESIPGGVSGPGLYGNPGTAMAPS